MLRALWLTDVLPQPVRRHLGQPAYPGPQAWVDRLAEELVRSGDVRVEIAAPCSTSFTPFEASGVWYHGVPAPPDGGRIGRILQGWRHRLAAPETLGAVGALVARLRPDLVHVQGTESVLGPAAVAGTAPCLVSLQGLMQACAPLYFAGRTPGDVARLVLSEDFVKGRGVAQGYVRYRQLARQEAAVMRAGRWFVGRTDWDRAVLLATNPSATYFHCDEIVRDEFWDADWAAAGGRRTRGPRLYSTASAMPFKGTETLLRAAALLLPDHPGLRMRVAGVPDGSEMDRLYRRAARRLGIDAAVDWLGRLDAAAIAAELEAADAFVYPSHIDNSPNAVVEAMLAGTPVVASFTGGIPSLLEDGAEGLLVPRGDAPALAAAVRRLLDDRELAARLGSAARARARRRNDPARVTARMTEIYREVVAAEHGAGRRMEVHS
ncbi:MAG: glycosyltransferase family 4 protein [Actinobacteria bacterium]|nr:glycosyltransferase family 4 protein [Actinomycetota bacterium]